MGCVDQRAQSFGRQEACYNDYSVHVLCISQWQILNVFTRKPHYGSNDMLVSCGIRGGMIVGARGPRTT